MEQPCRSHASWGTIDHKHQKVHPNQLRIVPKLQICERDRRHCCAHHGFAAASVAIQAEQVEKADHALRRRTKIALHHLHRHQVIANTIIDKIWSKTINETAPDWRLVDFVDFVIERQMRNLSKFFNSISILITEDRESFWQITPKNRNYKSFLNLWADYHENVTSMV